MTPIDVDASKLLVDAQSAYGRRGEDDSETIMQENVGAPKTRFDSPHEIFRIGERSYAQPLYKVTGTEPDCQNESS